MGGRDWLTSDASARPEAFHALARAGQARQVQRTNKKTGARSEFKRFLNP